MLGIIPYINSGQAGDSSSGLAKIILLKLF